MISRKYAIAVLVGLAMFVAVAVIDRAIASLGMRPEVTYLDDVLLGILAGILVFILQLQHERELARQRRSAIIIEQMNHHIRNALQVIVYSMDPKTRDSQELHDMQASIDRIDWALREILPSVRR